jgi:ferric-dicitrate binding protein FerR (iron transport regulator)
VAADGGEAAHSQLTDRCSTARPQGGRRPWRSVTTTVPTLPVRREAAAPPPAARLPRWHPAGLTALLAGTAVLYLWGLSRSGWANAFYSAAAQAGGTSWWA